MKRHCPEGTLQSCRRRAERRHKELGNRARKTSEESPFPVAGSWEETLVVEAGRWLRLAAAPQPQPLGRREAAPRRAPLPRRRLLR